MSDIARLERGIMDAQQRGDEDAIRVLGTELRRIQAQGQQQPAAQGREPRGLGIQQQMASGVANTALNAGAGLMDTAVGAADKLLYAPIDFITGGWEAPERFRENVARGRERVRGMNEARNERFDENATGVEKGAALGTELVAFGVPAAKVDRMQQGANWINRGIRQATAAFGVDDVMQRGEGAEEKDQGRAGLTAGAAFAAEAVAPILARVGRAVIRGIKSSTDSPIDIGREIARRAGVEDVPDDLAQKLANAADEIDAGARPEAVIAEQEFGFQLPRGQKTQNRRFIEQEDLLRQRDTRAGERINALDDANRENLDRIVAQETANMSSPQSAVDDVAASVRGARDSAKQSQKAAWDRVRSGDESLRVSAGLADDFNQRLSKRLRESGRIVTEKITPEASEVIGQANEVLRRNADGAIDFDQIDEVRRMMVKQQGAVRDPSSRAAIGIAKDEFLNAVDDLAEDVVLSGNLDQIRRMKEAVGTSREFFRRFTAANTDDKIGKTVENILKNGNSDDLTAALLGAGEVSHRSGVNFARGIKRVLGDNAEELGKVKQAVLLKAMTDKAGETVPMGRISRNVKDLMRNRRDLMGELFDESEMRRLDRLTQALDSMTYRPPGRRATSGTTERFFRWMDQTAGDGVLGIIPRMIRNARESSISRAAIAPVRTTPTAPAIPAAAAAGTSNRPSGQ